MLASRRLSQRISEGDGIAIIVRVSDIASARAAEEQGAKGLAAGSAIAGLRESTVLPLLWLGTGEPVDADAVAIRPGAPDSHDIELVVQVHDEDELETALEEYDPEIFLLCPRLDNNEDYDPIESVLELLPDVPAGKLAIADVDVATRHEVLALERAGFDAVLVQPRHVGELVGDGPLDV